MLLAILLLLVWGGSGISLDGSCPRSLTSSKKSPPIDEAALRENLRSLGRFALEEVQRRDQPSSARMGLLEDLEIKLRTLSERSGHSIEVIQHRFRDAKRDLLFGAREPVRLSPVERTFRAERDQMPKEFAVARVLEDHVGPVRSIAFSPNGKLLASGGRDMVVRIWDAHTGALLHSLPGHSRVVRSVVFSPDGSALASSSGDGTVRIWNPVDGTLRATLTSGKFSPRSLVFSPDGSLIVAGADRGRVIHWNLRNDPIHPQTLWPGHGNVRAIAFSADGKLAATVSNRIWKWDWVTQKTGIFGRLRQVKGAGPLARPRYQDIISIAFSPDGKTIAGGCFNSSIGIWPVTDGLDNKMWPAYEKDPVSSVAFNRDGTRLLSGGKRGIKIWNPETSRLIQDLGPESTEVNSVAFSPDGTQIASGGETLIIWEKNRAANDMH